MLRIDLLKLSLPLIFTACTSTGTAATLPATEQSSDAPMRDSVARLATAWNAGDGDAWAAEFWPDGSLINILGVVFANSTAVAGVTDTILRGPFKGSTFTGAIRRSRFAGSAAAIIDVDVNITNFRGLPPGVVATQPGILLTRLTLLFENRNGSWKIEAAQNTAVPPPPG